MTNFTFTDYPEGAFKTAQIDGARVCYHESSVFKVQLGRYKGKYKTVFSCAGNLNQAALMYKGYNIGNGYKKRLICDSFNNRILARQFS